MHKKYPGGIFACDTDPSVRIGNSALTLDFSRQTGMLFQVCATDGRVLFGGSDETIRSLAIASGGHLNSYPPKFKHFYSLEPENMEEAGADFHFGGFSEVMLPRGVEFRMVSENSDWSVCSIVEFEALRSYVKIDYEVKRRAASPAKVRSLTFRLPMAFDDALYAAVPIAAAVPESRLCDMPETVYCKYGAFVRNERDDFTAALWSTDTDFQFLGKCVRESSRLLFSQEHRCAGDLKPGESIRAGSDYIMAFHGTLNDAVAEYCTHYAAKIPADTAPRAPVARDAVIFEANVGAILFDPDFSYSPYPELEDLKRDLPRIRALGFNMLQLMPKMPFPWYTVARYDDFHGTYGGRSDEELYDFIVYAKSLGFTFIFDIVVHGVVDAESSRRGLERYAIRNRLLRAGLQYDQVNPMRRNHPEYFRYDENGDISFIHTWSLDFDIPGLREEFFSHLEKCVEKYGADGFRFDCPYWGCEPNWSKHYPYWPGTSFSANVRLLREAKERILRKHPGILWGTEHEHAEWRMFMDVTYTYEEAFLLWLPNPGEKLPIYQGTFSGWDMQRWFDLRNRVLPRKDIVLQHHIDSHDSWWKEAESAFGRDRFGLGAARLITAFCMFVDGIFLGYAGTEAGSEEYFAEMLAIRASDPVFTWGGCDYISLQAGHRNVVVFRRKYENSEAVILCNFSEENSRFKLSGELSDRVMTDLVDGRREYRLTQIFEMRPNQILILKMKRECK